MWSHRTTGSFFQVSLMDATVEVDLRRERAKLGAAAKASLAKT